MYYYNYIQLKEIHTESLFKIQEKFPFVFVRPVDGDVQSVFLTLNIKQVVWQESDTPPIMSKILRSNLEIFVF